MTSETNKVKTSTKKLILFLPQDTFFLSHFEKHARTASKCGFIVWVLAKKTSDDTGKKISELGYKFIDSKIARESVSLIGFLADIVRIAKIYRTIRPDVAHHFGTKSIFVGTIASLYIRLRGVSVGIVNNLIGLGRIFTSKGIKALFLQTTILMGYYFLLNPRNSRVICENKDDIDLFVKNKSVSRKDTYLVPGAGIDIDEYHPIPFEKKEKKITAIMCCRLLRSKGVEDFIEAARILKRENAEIQLWLVGEPDLQNGDTITEEQFRSWRKENTCRVLGFRKDINLLLMKSHICVLPSYYREGFPRALVEGLASGLAIVTANSVGCRDAVTTNNGILVPPKDPYALAKVLENLANNQDELKLMGKRSRKFAEEHLSDKKICSSVMEIYKEVLSCEK